MGYQLRMIFEAILSVPLGPRNELAPDFSNLFVKGQLMDNLQRNRHSRRARLEIEALECRAVPAIGDIVTTQTFDFGGSDDIINDIAFQSTGKMIAVGMSNGNWAVARFNLDLSLDTTFGTNGKFSFDSGNASPEFANAVVIDSQDRILLAGVESTFNDAAITRLNADGKSVDSSFATNLNSTVRSFSLASFDSSSVINDIALDSAGRIVVVGQTIDSSGNQAIGVARLLSNGTLDNSFSFDGLQRIDFDTNAASPESGQYVAINPTNEKIVVAGTSTVTGSGSLATISQLNPDGSLDKTFSGDGKTVFATANTTVLAVGLGFSPDGSIVLGTNVNSVSEGERPVIFRLNSSGNVIAQSASLFLNAQAKDNGKDLVIQPDGSIVIVAQSNFNAVETDFGVARVNSNFQFDTNFSADGKQFRDFPGLNSNESPQAVALDPTGRLIVVAGTTDNGTGSKDFALMTLIARAPNAPTITGISPDTGASSTDGLTNDNTVTILGSADPNTTVRITQIGLGEVGSAVANAKGFWFFDVTGAKLADGPTFFNAVARDETNTLSLTGNTFTVTVDRTPPSPANIVSISEDTGVSNSDRITNDPTITFSGTTDPNTRVNIFNTATLVSVQTKSDASGVWVADFSANPLSEGINQFQTEATDEAGNTRFGFLPFIVNLDTVAPTSPTINAIDTDTGSSSSDGITADNTLIFSGTAEAKSIVELTRVGIGSLGTTTADDSGNWTLDLTGTTLADGDARFTATSSDVAGNQSSASPEFVISIDTTPPTVTVEQNQLQPDPTNATTLNFTAVFSETIFDFTDSDVSISGTAGGSNVAVTNPTGDNKTFLIQLTGISQDGSIIVTIPQGGATDTAGNGNQESTSTDNVVTVDLTAPTVTLEQSSTQADPGGSPIQFTATFSESVTGFTASDVTVGGTAGGTFIAAISNRNQDFRTFTISVSGMTTAGTVTARIRAGVAQDQAGNLNLASTSLDNTVTFELVSPLPPVSPPAPGLPPSPFGVGSGEGRGTVRFLNPDRTPRFEISPFGNNFTGGVRTATADFNNDGVADLVVGTGPGRATRVLILDGSDQSQLFAIDPFEASFTGGVFVSTGDLNGDGVADLVITPDEGGGPRARVFSGKNFAQLADFFGIDDPNFRGGARSGTGDLNGDGRTDLIIVAGFGGGPRVAAFDGSKLANNGGPKLFGDFLAFEPELRNGIFVAAGDIDGDGFDDLIAGAGPGGGPRVSIFDGALLLQGRQVRDADFFAGDTANRGGVRVASANLDGDAIGDVISGAGTDGGSRVTAYAGSKLIGGSPPSLFELDAFPGFTGGVFVG